MIHYTQEQLAIVVCIPTVTIFLVWTTAIFHKNRKKWGPYDIPIVSILVLSIIRNLTIFAYVLVQTLNHHIFNLEYCSILIWIFNSAHTFQASNLTTLAVIGLFSVKLNRKQDNIKNFLTSTHIIYHLFCLTTLCACVGVAALLAKTEKGGNFTNVTTFEINPCKLMPFDLDIKYNVFIIVLHVFLASISFLCFVLICFNIYKLKKGSFDYIKKSNSHSSLSIGHNNNNNNGNNEKNYYDTYTIHRATPLDQNFFINGLGASNQNGGFYNNRENVWNSDVSNMSTTVSSTNSRRPCIAKQSAKEENEYRTGLETINPILIVCYFIFHIPLIIFCIYPRLIAPWPVAGAALWLGLLQDLLIPIGLGLVDSRFTIWVSSVYKCSRRGDDKIPHVGLDGKFRPFGSQPQSLEISQIAHDRNSSGFQTVEHRFPITNGSLYTSIDGRLPVIHNYRRHKDHRGIRLDQSTSNLALNSAHLKRPDITPNPYCRNCEADLCPSHSNLHHLSPTYINQKLNILHQNNMILQHNIRSACSSHESLGNLDQNFVFTPPVSNNSIMRNSRNLLRLNKMRLSKSEDSLMEIPRNLSDIRTNQNLKDKKRINREVNEQILDYTSSDEDYSADLVQENHFDSLSSKSSCSITTEANCDFHFYQSSQISNDSLTKPKPSVNNLPSGNQHPSPPNLHDFQPRSPRLDCYDRSGRITRSNSKRSLENFKAFVDDRNFLDAAAPKIQRSCSYMTIEDRRRKCVNRKLLRGDSKSSDCTHRIRHKIRSVEYLPYTNASTVLIEDVRYLNYPNSNNCCPNYVGSVPDLKKVFISEYI